MIRSIAIGIYLYANLLFCWPWMKKYEKLTKNNNAADDMLMFKQPLRWSKGIVRLSGCNVRYEGLENIPKNETVLFTPNHKGYLDIFTMCSAIGDIKPSGFVAKIELQKIPLVNRWMSIMGSLFLDREDRRASLKLFRDGIQRMKDGHSLVVFPEGTRSSDDTFGEFKGGSLRLAKDGNAVVVPVAIYGTADAFENNGGKVKPTDVVLRFLPAISNDALQERDLNDIAADIQKDIEREYFDIKASLKK